MQGSCYKFFSTKLTWTAAKAACEKLGSKLVSINSQAEQQAVTAKITQNTWIGLYRDPRDNSRFLWVDGSRLTYSNWDAKEPNNFRGAREDCTETYPKGGGGSAWNDLPCSYNYPYVCETSGRSGNTFLYYLLFSKYFWQVRICCFTFVKHCGQI